MNTQGTARKTSQPDRPGLDELVPSRYALKKPMSVREVIGSVRLVGGLSRRPCLDSSMRTRHRIVGASRNGSPKKHSANY